MTWHAFVGHVERCFNHREDEPFNAKTVVAKISPFGLKQPFGKVIRLCMIGQQLKKPILRELEKAFVVPQRIICVETYSCKQVRDPILRRDFSPPHDRLYCASV